MTYRLKNIGIAVALALVAGLLTVFYVTNYKRDVRSAEASVTVYVASKDIPSGTTGATVISDGYLAQQAVAKRSVTPGAISSPEQLNALVAGGTIYAGEQVTTRRFTTEETKGIRAQITGAERAIAIAGNKQQTLADTLKAGDHVDVLASWNVPEAMQNHVSRVVLRDILVLEVPTSAATDAKLTEPGEGGNAVMLALTDAQSQKLFWVVQNGAWTLALRPPDKDADSPNSAESALTILKDGLGAAEFASLLPDEGGQ
jgi:Flp pilus assembly protein CpaB